MRALLANVFLLAAAASLGYTALALARVRAFRSGRDARRRETPPFTVLKPLHGDEPDLYENLRSFCDQQYPSFQIVFTAAQSSDPALETARRLQMEFPGRRIDIAAGGPHAARNPKIGNVLGGYASVQHDVIVIADSDIRVRPEYLAALAEDFSDPAAGAVTCLYGGVPNASLASRLGAMQINDTFAPSVLVAQAIEPLTYCFGATMAVRRDVLERAGGLQTLAGHLGDDYHLGQLVVKAGRRVVLSRFVVRTGVHETRLADLWKRELRWARTILAARPAGYAGSILTYALPLCAVYAALSLSAMGTGLFAAAVVLRTALHYASRARFAPETAPSPWLIPLRDCLGVAVWAAAFFGSDVRWRSAEYRLEAGGRMAADPKDCNDSVTG